MRQGGTPVRNSPTPHSRHRGRPRAGAGGTEPCSVPAGPRAPAGPGAGPGEDPGAVPPPPGRASVRRAPSCTAGGCAAIFALPLPCSDNNNPAGPSPLSERGHRRRGGSGARAERPRARAGGVWGEGLEPRREGAALSPPRCCSAETRRPEQEGSARRSRASGQPWGILLLERRIERNWWVARGRNGDAPLGKE